jgi:hypothetical protein
VSRASVRVYVALGDVGRVCPRMRRHVSLLINAVAVVAETPRCANKSSIITGCRYFCLVQRDLVRQKRDGSSWGRMTNTSCG